VVEVARVLKPGAHLVAFSGTRTYHRMACAIEDAGFEIRDQLAWIYGSGFPKSHDVAKGIAKARTEDIEPTRRICRFVRAAMDSLGLRSSDLTQQFGDCNSRLIDHWAARDTDSQPNLPTPAQWLTLKAVLMLGDDMDAEVARLNHRKGSHGARWAEAPVIGETTVASPGFGEHRFTGDRTIRDLDDGAAEWQGWGTALKPSQEPICLARKPLVSTVAANVLQHGTGAINIDGCRVEAEGRPHVVGNQGSGFGGVGVSLGSKMVGTTDLGRWPANIIHDGSDEVLAGFPHTASRTDPSIKKASAAENDGNKGPTYGAETRAAGSVMVQYGDEGSAARFFYSAKVTSAERGEGNNHPTVKPVDLMRWLCRLVTPRGGTVLDPFCGSGSTLIAADAEQFHAIGCESSPEYAAIAEQRVRNANQLFAEVTMS